MGCLFMKSKSEAMLKVSALTKSVQLDEKTLELLQPVHLTVNSGETLAIVGSSGSGKTTLLSILAGLDLPTSGEVYLKNHPLHQFNEEQRSQVRADHVGFIFQQFLLISSLTALENVMLPAELANLPDAKEQGLALLASVGLAERAEHYPSQLSGGEQQRVAIARAVINEPQLILADEPTGSLDQSTSKEIFNLFLKFKSQNRSIIFATHNRELADKADYKLRIIDGNIRRSNEKYK